MKIKNIEQAIKDKIIECCKRARLLLNDAKKVSEQTCLVLCSFAVEEFGKAIKLENDLKSKRFNGYRVPNWYGDHKKKYKAGIKYLKDRGCRSVFEVSVYVSSNMSTADTKISYGDRKKNAVISVMGMTTGWFADTTDRNIETLMLSPKSREGKLYVDFDRESHEVQVLNAPKGLAVEINFLTSRDIEDMIKCIESKLEEY